MQVQQWQNLRNFRGFPHVRWKDHAAKPLPFALLVDPPVIDPRSLNLDGPRPQHNLALSGVAVFRHEGMAPLVALCTGGVDVGLDLGFEGAGEHPSRSLSGDLVEIEHEPFADFIVLMYPFHRCASSSSKSLEKVHHALQGILDPQLLSISPKAPGVSLPGALKDIRFSLPRPTLPTTSRNLLS